MSHQRRRIVAVILVVVILLVVVVAWFFLRPVLLCCAPPPPPTTAGTGAFIFMSNRDGDWDIYLMTLPERTVQNLTDNDVDDGFGAFSEDGGAITFLSNRIPEEGLTAYMMNADGSGVSRVQNDLPTILNVLSTGRMTWDVTPDQPVSVLVSLRDLNLEVYTRTQDQDGATSERNLSSSGAIDWFRALSPDGRRIAFASDRDGNQEIYVMDVDGANLRRLTNSPGDDLFPAWVNSGQQIIFYSERDTTLANGALALYLIDADSDNPTAVRADSGMRLPDSELSAPVDAHVPRGGGWQIYMQHDGHDWDIYYADQVGRHVSNLTDNDADDIFPALR